MLQPLTLVVLAGTAALAACSPSLDWREVRVEPTPLKAMLPCKPESDSRQVPMGGRPVVLQALACPAGGGTFAILSADIGSPATAGEVLRQWQAASLATMRGAHPRTTPYRPRGALEIPESVQVIASGQRPDGSKVDSQAAYFARGGHVFQAVIYGAPPLQPQMTQPFFDGLRFE